MPPRTRSNRADFEESPTKKTRHDAPSTDESDIEVDLEESVIQVIILQNLCMSPIYARTPMRPAQGANSSSFAVQEVEPDNQLAEPDDPESGATLSASCHSSPPTQLPCCVHRSKPISCGTSQRSRCNRILCSSDSLPQVKVAGHL